MSPRGRHRNSFLEQQFRAVLDDGSRVPVLRLYGELDIASGSQLRQQTERLATRDLIVDLSGVDMIDSSGLRELRTLGARMQSHDAALALVSPPDSLPHRLMRFAGMQRILTICNSLDDVQIGQERGPSRERDAEVKP